MSEDRTASPDARTEIGSTGRQISSLTPRLFYLIVHNGVFPPCRVTLTRYGCIGHFDQSGEKPMLKALMGLVIAGAAALTIASPAAAAPICHDDFVVAYGGHMPTFAAYGYFNSSSFCDRVYDIVSVDWSVGSAYVHWIGSTYVQLDGIWTWPETAVITVTDGENLEEFTLDVVACFEGDYCPY